MRTKSGQYLQYGFTDDSRVLAQGKDIVNLWAICRLQDPVGNYLTYTYTQNPEVGEYYIKSVDYTGNTRTGYGLDKILCYH